MNIIKVEYGEEETIKEKNRYITPEIFLELIDGNTFNGYDQANLAQHLPLFNLSELLYRYVRCQAIHGYLFPFVTITHVVGNGIILRDNQAITGAVISETASNILSELKDECVRKRKWPWEL